MPYMPLACQTNLAQK